MVPQRTTNTSLVKTLLLYTVTQYVKGASSQKNLATICLDILHAYILNGSEHMDYVSTYVYSTWNSFPLPCKHSLDMLSGTQIRK